MSYSQYIKDNTLATSGAIINVDRLVNFLKSNTKITRLILRCSKINYEVIKELAQLSHLTSLDLSCSYVGTEGTKILASGNLINLTSLDLGGNEIGDEGVEALASGNLTSLTELKLYDNKIGDRGAKALASGNLTNLTLLSLGWNEISEKGAEALASGNLINLITLKVYDNSINYRGSQTLASGNLVHLTSIIFNYCYIDSTFPKNVLPSLQSRCNRRKIGEESGSKLSEVQASLHFESKGFKAI
ncbi:MULTISPECIES: leucine-rich repeat domain-containing protein [Wolbachia]|uniref:hypothetical protein n=1 Tax=Wolbachia TaxID=953 RepID=UPI00201FB87C|nr:MULTISPECIES: hypothetical protein [unclassified Wolbachia]URG39819.1 hypothetical protein M1L25_000966 [Wolbachia endosymbiont of Ostrinia furnacalis]URG40838.1 hypothetical protein M1L26_000969 [Wolbachia endosymbiont of Ostrinia scapulalis]